MDMHTVHMDIADTDGGPVYIPTFCILLFPFYVTRDVTFIEVSSDVLVFE